MMTPAIHSSASTPSPQPTSTHTTRAKPPTVQEVQDLDRRLDVPLKSFTVNTTSAAISLPEELTQKILGYVVRLARPTELSRVLRDLINLKGVSKGMRGAARRAMLESNEEWKWQAVLRDDLILRNLHGFKEGLKEAEVQALQGALWGMNGTTAREAAEKTKGAATAALLKANGLSACTDPGKNTWRVATFDSTSIADPQDWLAKASHVSGLLMDVWSADPNRLLISLAPQLEALDVENLAPNTPNSPLSPQLFEALQAGKIHSFGFPGMPPRSMANLIHEVCSLSQLETLIIRLGFAAGVDETSELAQVFTAIKSMKKLVGLKVYVAGNGFDEVHKTALFEQFRSLARECRTLQAIMAIHVPGKRLTDLEVCRLLAENCCYAPKTKAPAQPGESQS